MLTRSEVLEIQCYLLHCIIAWYKWERDCYRYGLIRVEMQNAILLTHITDTHSQVGV